MYYKSTETKYPFKSKDGILSRGILLKQKIQVAFALVYSLLRKEVWLDME